MQYAIEKTGAEPQIQFFRNALQLAPLVISNRVGKIDVGRVKDARSVLTNDDDSFTADKTTGCLMRRKVLFQSGPDIGQRNRIIFAVDFRSRFGEIECSLDFVSLFVDQQRVQGVLTLRVAP